MEDVLEVYHRPEDPKRPLICLDEASVQLLGEVREPLPMRPGAPLCVDSEYEREGVESYFMLMAPLLGWRHVEVTGTRTKVDYARVIKALAGMFPQAQKIVVVHPAVAGSTPTGPRHSTRSLRRTKHGGWLNASSSITRPSMGAGSTWRRLNWAF
jgi:hypothetical protein